ncbi:MAG: hypothetical protein ACI857_001130 [Arenicella sp.]|jgi:hypothetical protein
MKRIALIICLFIGFNSFSFEDLIFKGMENFTVEKKNDKIFIGFDYIIENPNKITVVIKPSALFLKIADKDCGWVRIEEKIKIKKKSEAAYPFMLVGDQSNFVKSTFASIWNLISGSGIDFNIAGDIKAGIIVFKKKWAVDYTYKMSNDEFMSFF